MSDPVTHEIDLEVKALDDYLSGRMGRPQDTPTFGKFRRALRKLRARAEAAEAERDALRARVPYEHEVAAFRVAVTRCELTGEALKRLRALVARNTPKEKTDGE